MSVRRAQAEIDSAEFTRWIAYFEIEPFGDVIADQRHGVATAVLANAHRSSESRGEPYHPDDFIYWRDTGQGEEEEPTLLDDPVAQANLIRAAMFGLPPKSAETQ